MSDKLSNKHNRKKLKLIFIIFVNVPYSINSKIMSLVDMPTTIHAALNDMVYETKIKTIEALAAKYGFDVEDAKKSIGMKTLKTKKLVASEKPKRAPTGYLLYAASVRDEVKSSLNSELSAGEKLKPNAIVCAIAELWKQLDASTKNEWNEKAKTPMTPPSVVRQPAFESPPPIVQKVKDGKKLFGDSEDELSESDN